MVFIFGFLLGLAGCAFVLVPGIQWFGKTVPRKARLWTGGIFAGFLPVVILTRSVFRLFDPEETINLQIVYWSVAMVCLVTGWIIVVRSTKQPRPIRKPAAGGPEPFIGPEIPVPPVAATSGAMAEFAPPPPPPGNAPPWMPPDKPAAQRPGKKPAAPPHNPFDFS